MALMWGITQFVFLVPWQRVGVGWMDFWSAHAHSVKGQHCQHPKDPFVCGYVWWGALSSSWDSMFVDSRRDAFVGACHYKRQFAPVPALLSLTVSQCSYLKWCAITIVMFLSVLVAWLMDSNVILSVGLSACPPLWIDWHEILCRHSWFTEVESYWLWRSSDLHHHEVNNFVHWNVLTTFQWIAFRFGPYIHGTMNPTDFGDPMNSPLVTPWGSHWWAWVCSETIERIAIKFGTNIHVSLRIFGDPLTSLYIYIYDLAAKLMAFLSALHFL